MRQAVRAIITQGDQILLMQRNKFGHVYYILLGGGIDPGETPEQALVREIYEESSLRLTSARPVFVQHMHEPYGSQYIYLCEATGTVALSPDSEEAKINALGQNLHLPLWVPIKNLPDLSFRTPELQQAIIKGLQHGFPAEPIELSVDHMNKTQASLGRKG